MNATETQIDSAVDSAKQCMARACNIAEALQELFQSRRDFDSATALLEIVDVLWEAAEHLDPIKSGNPPA